MRITALVLSLYVFFLASIPLLTVITVLPEISCCLDICAEEHNEKREDTGGGCSEVCNPFLSCQCCLGFPATANDPSCGIVDANPSSYNNRLQPLYPSQVIFPVWHPPKA